MKFSYMRKQGQNQEKGQFGNCSYLRESDRRESATSISPRGSFQNAWLESVELIVAPYFAVDVVSNSTLKGWRRG